MAKHNTLWQHGVYLLNRKMKIILASNSPRRKELLEEYGYDFSIVPSSQKEEIHSVMPYKIVKDLSRQKAISVFKSFGKKNNITVIGADTIVAFKGKIIGKPKDENEAYKTLKMLSGKTHNVYTGIFVINNDKQVSTYVKSEVKFKTLSDETIKEYISTKSPMDKAGAYGIQDKIVVESFKGSYSNIVGLPMERLSLILKEFI